MSAGSKAEKYGYLPPAEIDVRVTGGALAPLVGSKCEKYGARFPTEDSALTPGGTVMAGHELTITFQAGDQIEAVEIDEEAVQALMQAASGTEAVHRARQWLRNMIRRSATEALYEQGVTDYIQQHIKDIT